MTTLSKLKSEQLETYLRSLTPDAARILIQEIERDRLKGGTSLPHETILDICRRALDAPARQRLVRLGSPMRVFCQPFDDLVVDRTTTDKQVGRISRASVRPVWEWLSTIADPDEFGLLQARLTSALLEHETDEIAVLGHELHVLASRSILRELAPLETGDKEYRRLAVRLGSEKVLEDARDIANILACEPELSRFRQGLPDKLSTPGSMDVDRLAGEYEEAEAACPGHGYLYLLSVAARMEVSADVMRIVVKIVGSEADRDLRASPLAVIGDCMLHDIDMMAQAAAHAMKSRASITVVEDYLKAYFDQAESFFRYVEMDMRDTWGWRVVAVRNAIAADVKNEIEGAPRLIKTALYRKGRDPGTGHSVELIWPDNRALAEAEFVVRIMLCIQHLLDQIPLNADFAKIGANVRSFVESIGEIALDDVRRCEGEERRCAIAYLDAVISFSRLLFGVEESVMLERRAKVAKEEGEAA